MVPSVPSRSCAFRDDLRLRGLTGQLSALGRQRRWEEALSLLLLEREASIQADVVAFTALVRACARAAAKAWPAAIATLCNMEDRTVAPDVMSLGAGVDACAKASRWLPCCLLLQRLRTWACEANIIVFNSAITACERSSEWATAFRHLGLLGYSAMQPDVITQNSLITSCGSGTPLGESLWVDALELFKKSFHGLQRSLVTLNAVGAVFRKQRWEMVFDTFMGLGQRGMQPDTVTSGTVVTACVSGTQWQRILQQRLHGTGLVTLNAAISCEGWRESLFLAQLAATGEFGCHADTITFNTAASVCEKARRWEEAVLLLEALQDFRLSPDACTYNAALSACEKCSQWEKALQILFRMTDKRVTPDIISYNAATAACESSWESALALMHAMQGGHIAPDQISYHSAIGVCTASQQWETALCLCQSMSRESIRIDSISVSLEMSAQEKGRRWQNAFSACRSMATMGLQNNHFTYGAALSACKGQWHVALALLEEFWWRPEILTATLLGAALGSALGAESVSEPGSVHFVAWVLGLFGQSRLVPGAAVYAAALDSQARAGAYGAAFRVSGPHLAEELDSSSLTALRGNFLGKKTKKRCQAQGVW
ncbi:unnamed protein product [Symbiodinium sp. CCMP2456]|nr:unnamed protein product [Symbiodinium sp. CCMP2456]